MRIASHPVDREGPEAAHERRGRKGAAIETKANIEALARVKLAQLAGEKIHRGEELELYAIDAALVGALVERLERRVAFSLTVTDHELYVALGGSGGGGGASVLTEALIGGLGSIMGCFFGAAFILLLPLLNPLPLPLNPQR